MKEMPSPVRLTVQILQALHGLEDQLEGALAPLGLSLAKLNLLSKLADAREPLPLGTLADRCACVRSNITQLVDRLEADELVVRSDDPHDRRSVRAELTELGRSRHAAGFAALDAAEASVLARLPRAQREPFLEALQSLHGEG